MRMRADSVEENVLPNPALGDFYLSGATDGNRPFSVIGDGNECYYRAEVSDLSLWEIGSATYDSTSNTLTRDEVFVSSAGTGIKVSLIGDCVVYLTLLSREIDDLAASAGAMAPLVTGALPGPEPIADGFGQFIMVPI